MLPSNIEDEIRKILEKTDGWLRVEECAQVYSNGDKTKRTKFYRWRKKIEKGKVKGFQILPFPGNVVFIGLKSANPNKVFEKISSNEETVNKMKKYFEGQKSNKSDIEFSDAEATALAHFYQHETRYMRNFSKLYIWLKRGAKPEEKPQIEK